MTEGEKKKQLMNLIMVNKELDGLIKQLEGMLIHYEYTVSLITDHARLRKSEMPFLAGDVVANLQSDTRLLTLLMKGQIGGLTLFNQYIKKDTDIISVLIGKNN